MNPVAIFLQTDAGKVVLKLIAAAVIVLIIYMYINAQVKKARLAKGTHGMYDPKDVDPTINFDATAKRVHDVFITPLIGSGSDENAVLQTLMSYNDSEFILAYNTYNDSYCPETIKLFWKINSMRDAVNNTVLPFSSERDAVNSRFDRLNLA